MTAAESICSNVSGSVICTEPLYEFAFPRPVPIVVISVLYPFTSSRTIFSKASATSVVFSRGVPIGIVMLSVTESSLPFGIIFICIVGISAIAITRRQHAITRVIALFESADLRSFLYTRVTAAIAFSKLPYINRRILFVTGFSALFESGRNTPARTGTRKMATKSEDKSAITIVKIIPLNICPIIPSSLMYRRKGTNTQIVVRFPEITDITIS